jgi:stearoyl-CoA desaturase (delta-9 desaturase)
MTIAPLTRQKPRYVVLLFMVGVHLGALLALLPGMFNWGAIALLVFLHWVTGGLGITLGWHRLVSHRSFQVPKWLEYLLVFFGTLSMQGGPLEWVGLHRHHHVHSDQERDHHDSGRGFWWSHMGWMFYDVPAMAETDRYTRDISGDPVYQFFQRHFFWIQVAFGGLLYLLGGWPFVIWGVFVRLVVVYHCTWLVNSATHRFGYRSYNSGDRSTNCWWVALLTYGEGWHNNHHAFQYSARHGLAWWELDLTWATIALLQKLGLATQVKLPNAKA